MSTRPRAEANPARCPDCSAIREHATASCDLCAYDPDRFVTEADTTWVDGSPATRLLMAETDHDAGNEVPDVLPIRGTIGPIYSGPVFLREFTAGDCDDNPAPPADLLTVERPAASRWWGWLLSLAVVLSWLLRGCR